MIQNMPKASMPIPVGEMYQEWSCLMDLVEGDTAKPRTIGRTYATIAKGVAGTQRYKHRHFIKEQFVLTSGDGVKFVVCNQCDKVNALYLQRIAKKQGWNY